MASAMAAASVPAWNAWALQALACSRTGPSHGAGLLAGLHTCMYNAWAAYDDDARQTAQGVAVRLPRAERDAASKARAMGHAAHAILTAALPAQGPAFDMHLRTLGLGPATAASPFSPAGIGRTQAAAMLDAWRADASVAPPPAAGAALLARWYGLAAWLSARDRHDDDQDVLLFFVLGNALAEAVAPASAAAAALRRFTGSDELGAGAPGPWATFTAAAGAEAGQEMGRQAGARVFERARRCWMGRL